MSDRTFHRLNAAAREAAAGFLMGVGVWLVLAVGSLLVQRAGWMSGFPLEGQVAVAFISGFAVMAAIASWLESRKWP